MPRRQKKVYRKRRAKKAPRRKQYSKIQSLRVRQPGAIVPDRMFMKMMYIDTNSNQLGTLGNTFGYVRYNANGLFDPNPLVLSTSAAGYNELSALYNFYRVRGCSITASASNMMDQPVNILIWPSNVDPAALITNAYLQGILAQPYSKFRALSAKGGMDRCTLKGYISTKKIAGSTAVGFDDTYSANVIANPTNLWFWNVASYSVTNTAYTIASIPFECRVTFYVEWYDRKVLG